MFSNSSDHVVVGNTSDYVVFSRHVVVSNSSELVVFSNSVFILYLVIVVTILYLVIVVTMYNTNICIEGLLGMVLEGKIPGKCIICNNLSL